MIDIKDRITIKCEGEGLRYIALSNTNLLYSNKPRRLSNLNLLGLRNNCYRSSYKCHTPLRCLYNYLPSLTVTCPQTMNRVNFRSNSQTIFKLHYSIDTVHTKYKLATVCGLTTTPPRNPDPGFFVQRGCSVWAGSSLHSVCQMDSNSSRGPFDIGCMMQHLLGPRRYCAVWMSSLAWPLH